VNNGSLVDPSSLVTNPALVDPAALAAEIVRLSSAQSPSDG
jgi:hypothetical protein